VVAATQPVAFVTGASRGIGKAIAVHLARAGYDVAIAARTRHDGEVREHSSTVKESDTRPLPGSLDATAVAVRETGREAMPVYLDLLDRASLGSAVTTVLERWGRIDVLVNNGRYVGPGVMDRFLDTPVEMLERNLEAGFYAPVILTQLVLPQMLERNDGAVVNIVSGVGKNDPVHPPEHNFGWGIGYGASKGAFNRIAGILRSELGDQGIRASNVVPGFVVTERTVIEKGYTTTDGAPPDVVGATVAWLVSTLEGRACDGAWVDAQQICRERALVPGWPVDAS
jgi:NAD(P)-dependent dehydrogenase (short-subunit alcohol dehydrogenase family)